MINQCKEHLQDHLFGQQLTIVSDELPKMVQFRVYPTGTVRCVDINDDKAVSLKNKDKQGTIMRLLVWQVFMI